jgi:hypothetical protein
MDWIEQLTDLDPDAGTGSLEVLIATAVVVVVVGFVMRRRMRRSDQETAKR